MSRSFVLARFSESKVTLKDVAQFEESKRALERKNQSIRSSGTKSIEYRMICRSSRIFFPGRNIRAPQCRQLL